MKILSCIPKQYNTFDDKFKWLKKTVKKYKPDIFVTPQEFFGGAVMMKDERDWEFEELFPILSDLCQKNNMALIVGVQEKFIDTTNRTAIWFIDENGEFQGRLFKFALPRYDHVDTHGFGEVTPETDFENRFKVFTIQGMAVTGIFCWEVYSDVLWTGLGIIKPDLVFNLIKFGPNAWPKVKKKRYKQEVVGFGYGRWAETDDGGWIDRLRFANIWQVKCPIITSTNSWNLNPRSMPLCGTISGIPGQCEDDHWYTQKEDKYKEIPEKIIITEVDKNRIRGAIENKYLYKQIVGEFPPMSIGKYTMHLKINRIETRILKGKELKNLPNKNKGFFD
ncbi:MAG: nitrilase-related carbon-nitrogen hydrolase [bacterium]